MHRCLIFLFTIVLCGAAEPTSKTNANLQKLLKRFPAADANKDGKIEASELDSDAGKKLAAMISIDDKMAD